MNKNHVLPNTAAEIVARATNPVILSVLVLTIISAFWAPGLAVWMEWGAVMLSFLVIFPLVYVYLRFFKKNHLPFYKTDPTRILKYHPGAIIFLGLVFGLPCLLLLSFLKMPAEIIGLLTALLATALLMAVINLYYRISFHLAAVTVLIIMAAVNWGNQWLYTLAFLPLIGWAKIRLGDHNIIQLITAVALSTGISIATLLLFDIL
ncbi:MAG TPA: hypothetical protein VLH15_08510 [Dehalococcoidales bacterium]|nr:hypothetical protein [Dehalococcoidales bacterium]